MKVVNLAVKDIASNMLADFNHRQRITQKWTQCNNQWELTEASDLREWNEEKRLWIPQYLQEQIARGGSVIAAFDTTKYFVYAVIISIIMMILNRHAKSGENSKE